ncbi:putative syntaxin 6 protein [Besnoitia besnoiti]|uniref:Putative syntaxin 6 protein n=1 Tax=Besnoitia besnoiti TaxID=94643 RepID=A0A2A9MMI5_BESBE|nr:putative syntaxin 6 protein [Besnoitia besnoiti]PFH37641.1 putative syntaxin 6 protein [Besnoitia besnoiti]
MNAAGAPSAFAARADPYYAARDETAEGVRDLERSFRDWQHRASDPRKQAAAASRLLETADELLEELGTIEKTVEAAERHAARFGLSPEEVQQRRAFVTTQRATLQSIQSRVSAALQAQKAAASHASSRVAAEANAAFFHTQQQQHEQLLLQQDSQLQELSQSADRLHETAMMINQELENQQRMLNELDEDIEHQTAQMNFLMRRMAKILKTSNLRQLCLILWLTCIAFLLFVLLIIT